jgi:AhpD family alkylhydroperoxidase
MAQAVAPIETAKEHPDMKRKPIVSLISAFAAVSIVSTTAIADEPPGFYANTYPQHALKAMLNADKILMGPNASIGAKTRELIALGVAAQIPCAYCVYVHTKKARTAGASEAEVREAVATAAHVRHWSTVLNGMAYDLTAFKTEVDRLIPSN